MWEIRVELIDVGVKDDEVHTCYEVGYSDSPIPCSPFV